MCWSVWLLCVLQTLNTQVEAALQSGLNFKDRFTTNSRKRLHVPPPTEQADEQQLAEGVLALSTGSVAHGLHAQNLV